MLRGTGHRVEKHQQKHQPVEVGGLNSDTAVFPERMIQLAQLITKNGRTSILNEPFFSTILTDQNQKALLSLHQMVQCDLLCKT